VAAIMVLGITTYVSERIGGEDSIRIPFDGLAFSESEEAVR